MAVTEETPKPRPRPIVRLGILLISHSLLVSVVCFIAGIVALLLLPVLAKNTYISENALMPGSANPTLSSQDVTEGSNLVKDIMRLTKKSPDAGIVQGLLAEYISELGAEVGYQRFYPHSTQFNPLHFFSLPDSGTGKEKINCSSNGINIVGIVRAPRGDGKEAFVLVTPYNSANASLLDAVSVGLTFSVFSMLTRATWLAKDIVWLIADSQYGEYASVAAWLSDYHMSVFSGFSSLNSDTCDAGSMFYGLNENLATRRKISNSFKRGGTMAAALIVKVVDKSEPFEDTLNLYSEASNGQMPNLDLINIVNYLAVHRQGLRVKIKRFVSLLQSKLVMFLAEALELVGTIAKRLNPQWKFGIPAAEYADGAATLASSLYDQALGIPTGSHGAFRDYQIDAVTLEFSPKYYSIINKSKRNEFLLQGGRLIEGVIRSVNNLLEKFHQSFFLYLLTSPSRFVSVGVYMIPFGLLVAPLPLMAASLYAKANNPESNKEGEKVSSPPDVAVDKLAIVPRSLTWLSSARKVLLTHFWGVVVSLLPYFVCQLATTTPTIKLVIWSMLSVVFLLLFHLIMGSQQKGDWAVLKSVTLSAAFIGLALMSVVNFATAEFGALLLVPMALVAHPLKPDLRSGSLKNLSKAALNMVLALIGFPPATFFLLKGGFGGFDGADLGEFWIWVESLWAWNSATYLYIWMIHLPCWLLCLHILLHTG